MAAGHNQLNTWLFVRLSDFRMCLLAQVAPHWSHRLWAQLWLRRRHLNWVRGGAGGGAASCNHWLTSCNYQTLLVAKGGWGGLGCWGRCCQLTICHFACVINTAVQCVQRARAVQTELPLLMMLNPRRRTDVQLSSVYLPRLVSVRVCQCLSNNCIEHHLCWPLGKRLLQNAPQATTTTTTTTSAA